MKNSPQQNTTVYALRLPVQLLNRVAKLAKQESRTVANVMRLILEEALNAKRIR